MFDNTPEVAKAAAATPSLEMPTKRTKLLAVAKWFAAHGDDRFGAIHNIEKMSPQVFAATPTRGTLFAAFTGALWEGEIRAPDMPTLGAVASYIGLDQSETNRVGCFCVHDQAQGALGSHVGQILTTIAAES